MNKYMRLFALFLIDWELRKMTNKALKAMKKDAKENPRSRIKLTDFLEDPSEWHRLRTLRRNIEGINNPWQGVFDATWTRLPKDQSKVEEFPEFESSGSVIKNHKANDYKMWSKVVDGKLVTIDDETYQEMRKQEGLPPREWSDYDSDSQRESEEEDLKILSERKVTND